MRIRTGAAMPEDADAVVPFEECREAGADRVAFERHVAPGENVREAGADIAKDAEALPAGRELSAHDLALLAALGVGRVEAGSRPRVAILSTGDELPAPEEPLRPGALRGTT